MHDCGFAVVSALNAGAHFCTAVCCGGAAVAAEGTSVVCGCMIVVLRRFVGSGTVHVCLLLQGC